MKVAARKLQSARPKEGANGRKTASRPARNVPDSRPASNTAQADLPKPPSHEAAWPQSNEQSFEFNSILAQICLIQLLRYTEEQYAARNSTGHRLVQTGQGWRIFSRLFDSRNALQSVRLFEHLLRFANDEAHAPARAFFMAYAPLSFEHDAFEEYIGPGVWTPDAGSRSAAVRVRRTLKRWSEWLEALAHFRTHQELRRCAEVAPMDKAIIFLWPLSKRYDWTHEELLRLLREYQACGTGYPCGSANQLISHCRGVLGLWKVKTPSSGTRSVLPAQTVADRLLRFLPAIQ